MEHIKLKIKLDLPEKVERYLESMQKWEDEGGRPVSIDDFVTQHNLPLKPGDLIKIKSGKLMLADGDFYYSAEIEKVNNLED